ncbi:MAG: hypothetical protein AAFR21_18300, partial [Pseudomonadota bacterium]
LALEEQTRERVPLDWARTQNNLGNALKSLGNRESGTARLEEAVAAYRLALEERTRERVPLDWLSTKYTLASTLGSLAKRFDASSNALAGQGFRDAANTAATITPEALQDIRPDIARTMTAELGNQECWYRALAIERTETADDFDKAVAACERARSIYGADRSTGDWVMTTHSNAYLHMVTGEVLNRPTMVQEGFDLFQEALADPNTEEFTAIADELQRDLERARRILAE